MKKIALLVAVIVASFPVFAQSLQSAQTSGLIRNQLDAALSIDESLPGPDFSTLKKLYLFGGLENLSLAPNTNSASGSLPLLGAFVPGTLPLGVFTRVSSLVANSTPPDSSVDGYSTAPKPVVSGTAPNTTTTNYNIRETNTATKYSARLWNTWAQDLTALTRIAGINVKGTLGWNLNDFSTSAGNYTEVIRTYYDSAAADIAPVETANTVKTTTKKALASDNTLTLAGGAYLQTGSLGHTVDAVIRTKSVDNSTATAIKQDAAPKKGAAGSWTDQDSAVTDTSGSFVLGGTYKVSLPVFSDDDKDSLAYASLNASLDVAGRKYTSTSSSAVTTFGVDGVSVTKGVATNSSTTDTLAGQTSLSTGLGVGKYQYWIPSTNLRLGLQPQANLSLYTSTNGSSLTKRVSVVKTDSDSNGVFTDAADTIVTTTTDYEGMVWSTGGTPTAQINNSNMYFSVGLPMGATVTIPGFPVTFNLGTSPWVQYSSTSAKTLATSTKVTVTTVDGASAAQGTTITPTVTQEANSVWNAWTLSFAHRFGLHLEIDKDVTADIDLAGSNLLTLDSIRVQFVIGL